MRLGFLAPALVVIGLVGLLAYGLTRDPSRIDSVLIGRPAPAFSVPMLADPQARLSEEDLRGRIAVLNVWASWCVGCREEHALLAELAQRGGVPVYGLNYKDRREDALRWLQRYGNVYMATGYDPAGEVGLDWGVAAVPETFVLDAAGIVRHKQIGAISRSDLEDTLLPLLKRLREEAS